MTLPEAKALLNCNQLNAPQSQTWFDLGCGSGLFSEALNGLLPKGSSIYAIDKKPASFISNQIKFLQSDFVTSPLPKVSADGILMANSLHFVKDQIEFLTKIKRHLLPDGVFLLVEYDMETPSHWVPYPVSFLSSKSLFKKAGFAFVSKIGDRPSALNNRKIYSALFQNLTETT